MSPELWVANASPLITLAKVGALALLAPPGRQLIVPEAVAAEVRAGPASDPARLALEAGFAHALEPAEHDAGVLEWGLGAGESMVIAVARRRGAVAILDDAEARGAARVLGVRVIGTLGVVLLARREGRIESAAAVMRALQAAGLRLDPVLLREALARVVGEIWEP